MFFIYTNTCRNLDAFESKMKVSSTTWITLREYVKSHAGPTTTVLCVWLHQTVLHSKFSQVTLYVMEHFLPLALRSHHLFQS